VASSARWQARRGGKLGEAKLGEVASSARPSSARWQARRGGKLGEANRGEGKVGEAKLAESNFS
jgi:hypothetical protein